MSNLTDEEAFLDCCICIIRYMDESNLDNVIKVSKSNDYLDENYFNEDYTNFKTNRKKTIRLIHPDKLGTGVTDLSVVEKIKKNSQDLLNAFDLFEAKMSRYANNGKVLKLVKDLISLRSVLNNLKQLDDSFLKIDYDSFEFSNTLKDKTKELERMRKKESIEKRESDNRERQRQEQEAMANKRIIDDTKVSLRKLVIKIVEELFITNSYDCNTPYFSANPVCYMNECKHKNNDCNVYTILPCCLNSLIHDKCLEEYFFNCLSDNHSDDTLMNIFNTNQIEETKLQCPLCSTPWYKGIIKINSQCFESSIIKKRNEMYFNNVFFLTKNIHNNEVIKMENENYILNNDNLDLRRKLSKQEDVINRMKLSELLKHQTTPAPNTSNQTVVSRQSNESSSSKVVSDLSLDSSINEGNNNDNDITFENNYNEDEYNIDSSIDNDNTHENGNIKTGEEKNHLIADDCTTTIIDATLLVKTIQKLQKKRKLNSIDSDLQIDDKFMPHYVKLDSGVNCLYCPFYPVCDKQYQYKDVIVSGEKLQKFRRHKCKAVNNDVIRISIKKEGWGLKQSENLTNKKLESAELKLN